jgi:DNA-binding beta-propeller fold protein YncE
LHLINILNPASTFQQTSLVDAKISGWRQYQVGMAHRGAQVFYIASGTGIDMVDLGDINDITITQQAKNGAGVVGSLFVDQDADILYLLTSTDLEAFDISSPLSPSFIDSVSVTSGSRFLAVDLVNDRAYAATPTGDFTSINISNPASLTSVGTASITTTDLLGIVVDPVARYIYATDINSGTTTTTFFSVDVSSDSPIAVLEDSESVTGYSIGAPCISADGDAVFFIERHSSGVPYLYANDVSNPAAIVARSDSATLDGITSPAGLAAYDDDGYVYVANQLGDDFYSIDVSNPAAIFQASKINNVSTTRLAVVGVYKPE